MRTRKQRAKADAPRARLAEPEDFEAILALVADGMSLRQACKRVGLNRGDLWRAMQADPELRSQYARARECQAEAHQERINELAQELEAGATGERAQVLRVALDARKWAASKLHPALYGDAPPRAETTVNIGELHLMAVRKAVPIPARSVPLLVSAEDACCEGEEGKGNDEPR